MVFAVAWAVPESCLILSLVFHFRRIHCFDSVTAVLFVAALSEYDLVVRSVI